MRKIYFLLVLVAGALACMSFMRGGFGDSTTGPTKHNTSPFFTSCAQSGCHTGKPVNSELGYVDIVGDIPESGWEPGETYTIKARVFFPGRQAFGFKLMAWGKEDSASVGSLMVRNGTDNCIRELSKLRNNLGTVYDTNYYVTHSLSHVAAPSEGSMEWTFQWIAPATRDQEVVFYAAFNAANGDGTAFGDFMYTFKKGADTLSRERSITTANLKEQKATSIGLSAHYLSEENAITCFLETETSGNWDLEMCTLSGEWVALNSMRTIGGIKGMTWKLNQKPATGVYVLRISNETSYGSTKIIIP
jgi:hypothetical protein